MLTDDNVLHDVKPENDLTADNEGVEDQDTDGIANSGDTGEKKPEHMIPKSRLDEVLKQKKSAEDALKTVAEELIQDVPEEFRDLVPDASPGEKVRWIRNAIKKGLFGKPSDNGPDTKRPGGKPPVDLEGMNPSEMIKLGYK